MSPVLVDASAWIHYLRDGGGSLADALESLLEENRAALCGYAITEVRQGLRAHEERGALELFEILPWIDTTRGDFERAGELLSDLRRRGTTIPTVDGLVAALCLGRGLALLENDRHYQVVPGLELHPWRNENPGTNERTS